MTAPVSTPAIRNPANRPHLNVRLGAAALGLGLFASTAAPAVAACGAGPIHMSTGEGPGYTCTRNCTATGGARVIRSVTFGSSATVSQCLNECTATAGCTQVSYVTTVEMRDGVPIVRLTCTLMGAGDTTTMDVPPTVGRTAGVCTRDSGTIRLPPDLFVDRRFQQDHFRSGPPIRNFIPNGK